MNLTAPLIKEPVHFRRRLVAQSRVVTTCQEGTPQLSGTIQWPGEGGIDTTTSNNAPAPRIEVRPYGARTHAGGTGLIAVDDSVLGAPQLLEHGPDLAEARTRSQPTNHALWKTRAP